MVNFVPGVPKGDDMGLPAAGLHDFNMRLERLLRHKARQGILYGCLLPPLHPKDDWHHLPARTTGCVQLRALRAGVGGWGCAGVGTSRNTFRMLAIMHHDVVHGQSPKPAVGCVSIYLPLISFFFPLPRLLLRPGGRRDTRRWTENREVIKPPRLDNGVTGLG